MLAPFFAAALLVLSVTLASQEVRFQHKYKHSLKRPYTFFDNHTLPFYWSLGGMHVTHDLIRLTPSLPRIKSALWSRLALDIRTPKEYKGTGWTTKVEWKLHIQQVHARSVHVRSTDGLGLVFWLTAKPSLHRNVVPGVDSAMGGGAGADGERLGSVLGAESSWNGLGIVFSPFNDVSGRSMPMVFAVVDSSESKRVNEFGDKHVISELERVKERMGECFLDYVSHSRPLNARLTIQDMASATDSEGKYKVELFLSDPKNVDELQMSPCFSMSDVKLPPQVHLGMTAQTNRHGGDQHDLVSIDVFQTLSEGSGGSNGDYMNMPHPPADEKLPELDAELKKQFEEVNERVHKLREQFDHDLFDLKAPGIVSPPGSHVNGAGADASNSDRETMERIMETQFKILTNLEGVGRAIGSGGGSTAGGSGGDSVGDVSALRRKLEEVEQSQHKMSDTLTKLNQALIGSGADAEGDALMQRAVKQLSNVLKRLDELESHQRQSTGQVQRQLQQVETHAKSAVDQKSDGWFAGGWSGILMGQVVLVGVGGVIYAIFKRSHNDQNKKFI